MSEERRRIEINWVQTSAGALAAVSSAVLLSTVGVAGTVIGAALGSLAATVGSAVYSHYLRVSRDRVAAVAAAKTWARKAQAESRGAADPDTTAEMPADGGDTDDDAAAQQAAGVSWREAFTGLPWRHILWAASALFVAVMIAIVTFELATGRAVSSYTGGSDKNGPRSSVPGLGGGGGGTTQQPTPSATVTTTGPDGGPTGTVSAEPTAGGTGAVPSAPAGTPTSTATGGRSPSATPTTPTTPSATPTPTPASTASPTPAG